MFDYEMNESFCPFYLILMSRFICPIAKSYAKGPYTMIELRKASILNIIFTRHCFINMEGAYRYTNRRSSYY